MTIENRHVLITGGTSGIGLALCQALLRKGANVTIVARDSAKLSTLQKDHPDLHTFECDISDLETLPDLANEIHAMVGPIDILINNAAIQYNANFNTQAYRSEATIKASQEITTNLTAPIHLTLLFLNDLILRNNTAVVNISSALAYIPRNNAAIYSASKAGLSVFTQALRGQLKSYDTLVFEVIPPLVATKLAQHTPGKKVSAEYVAQRIIQALHDERETLQIKASKTILLLARFFPKLASRILNKGL